MRKPTITSFQLMIASLAIAAIVAVVAVEYVRTNSDQRIQYKTTKDLLVISQFPRATTYPGVTAWLQHLLRSDCDSEPDLANQNECRAMLLPAADIPTRMSPIRDYLNTPERSGNTRQLLTSERHGRVCLSEYLVHTHRYVAAQPALGSECRTPFDARLLDLAIPFLESEPPPPFDAKPFGRVHAERAYVMTEDGQLISRRFTDTNIPPNNRGSEFNEFSHAADNDNGPTLVSVRPFFSIAKLDTSTYTGTYVDVTDLGIVATGTKLIHRPEIGDVIIAIDMAISSDWVTHIPHAVSHVLVMTDPESASWKSIAQFALDRGEKDLSSIAQRCAGADRYFDTVATCSPTDDPTDGVVSAVMIGGSSGSSSAGHQWLIAWIPKTDTAIFVLADVGPIAALALVGFVLIVHDRKQRAALRETKRNEAFNAEKLSAWISLIDQLSLPIVSIDASTDRVRYANAAATSAGIHINGIFRDAVYELDRDAYSRFNVAGGEAERSYVVRLQSGSRSPVWGVIRSTSATRPLSGINLQMNDRLGVVSLLSEHELRTLREYWVLRETKEERKRLGSLISHGVAMLTALTKPNQVVDPTIRTWIFGALIRRLNVVAELLSGWAEPLELVRQNDKTTTKAQFSITVDRIQRLAAYASRNRSLRSILALKNGALSDLPAETRPFTTDFSEWPEDLMLASLIDGADGFVFDEVILNALKHSPPGMPPLLRARVLHTTRQRWVEFEITNQIRSERNLPVEPGNLRYHGKDLVAEACRRLRWEIDAPEVVNGVYKLRIRARTSENSANE